MTAGRELVRRLVERGHEVEVFASTIVDVHGRPARARVENVDGATVHYLATPVRYRWMGITPGLPLALARSLRPDVVHVFGFRDPVTTGAAAWCRVRGIPYVFEPLGMFAPRVRKVALKQVLDATLYRGVAGGAKLVVAVSERERDDLIAGGVEPAKIRVRGNGFPDPTRVGPHEGSDPFSKSTRVVLYVGRIATGKGLEHLVAAANAIPDAHVVVVGPDDRHGADRLLEGERIHVLPPTDDPPFHLYRAADVVVLPSSGESFGMSAAEAAAVGTPVVVTDRCGVASSFEDGEALVVPYERSAIVEAIERVLREPELHARLSRGGLEAAKRSSWDRVTDLQEEIYREAASQTAATKLSTDGS